MATEKRLIDANTLPTIETGLCDANGNMYGAGKVVLWEDIEKCPTVDAVEVVHGQVIVCDGFESDYHEECSVCGSWEVSVGNNYCPNCGAKMDGGKEKPASI